MEWRGGYGETTQQGTRTCTQQSNRSHGGGVVGDDDDDDDNNNGHDDDNEDNGGCGEQDGHHRMRKGRGHDDRTITTIKSITEEGGGRRW